VRVPLAPGAEENAPTIPPYSRVWRPGTCQLPVRRSPDCCGASASSTTTCRCGSTATRRRSTRRPGAVRSATATGGTSTTVTSSRCPTRGSIRGTRLGTWRSTTSLWPTERVARFYEYFHGDTGKASAPRTRPDGRHSSPTCRCTRGPDRSITAACSEQNEHKSS
jgi:hypothetical protein